MLCRGCGAEISNSQLFCPHCGTKNEPAGYIQIAKKCVNCGKGFAEGIAFCDVCGGNLIPVQPGSIPNMAIPNRIPANQMSSNQPYQGQFPQGQPYQGQMPSGMPASNQAAPGQLPPYQMPQGQAPQGPMGSGPIPAGTMPPNMMPPFPPPAQLPPRKKSPLLPILIAAGALIFIAIGVIGVFMFVNYTKSQKEQTVSDTVNDDTVDIIPGNIAPNDIADDAADNPAEETTDDAPIFYMYSYAEFPDAISIDSYTDFSYYDYSYSEDVATYTFLYSDIGKTEEDFYDAVSQYGDLLINMNGFYYEDDFSSDLYDKTGEVTDYYSKDDFCIGVTASVEDNGWYAYINIYDLTDVADTASDTDTADTAIDGTQYEMYYYYIDGRELAPITQYEEVTMDNGIAFYLNDILVTDNGDGTATVDCDMDLTANLDDCSFYSDDFMIMPKDAYGNILGDVAAIKNITDSDGSRLSTPVLLDTDSYTSYTISFTVPSDTSTFTFYGVNIELDDTGEDAVASGDVYYINIYIQ